MPRTAVVALLCSLALGGCSSSDSPKAEPFDQPAESEFMEGPCQIVAGSILSIGRDARMLGEDSSPPADVRMRLERAQDAVFAVQEGLAPTLMKPFSDVVISIGLVRLRSDSNSYEPSAGAALSKAYEDLVTACTAKP